VSDETGGLSDEPASRASKRRKPNIPADGEIVPLDEVSPDRVPLDTVLLAAPPREFAALFADPPLVGNERREDFDKFFSAIAAAVKPADAIAWLYTWDIAYLSWEIKRERVVKADIIKSARISAVGRILDSIEDESSFLMRTLDVRKNDRAARQSENNSKSRREIDQKLADNGYGPSDILVGAYNLGAANIDAIDRRIASYETRRMAVMRAVEDYNEKFARKLGAASKDIVEAEFNDLPPEDQ
jgi:hypothetical protein